VEHIWNVAAITALLYSHVCATRTLHYEKIVWFY